MVLTLLYCLTMAWDAPSDSSFATCSMSLDQTVQQTGIVNFEASVCLSDTATHTVKVQCFNDAGVAGPMSDESDVIQMIIQPPFYAIELPLEVRADLTNNGTVGMSDFGAFSSVFGCSHDGLGNVVSCP